MPSDLPPKLRMSSAEDGKINAESPAVAEQELRRGGYSVAMTHAERQAFWQTSEVGQKLGITHFSPDAEVSQ